MSQLVITGAMLKCSFGVAPSPLTVVPKGLLVNAGGPPAATIMDFAPMANIKPFGLCNAPTNPTVIAATAAKLGVFSPMPCLPVTVAPWTPGSPTVLINNFPALNSTSTCMCMWAGVITVASPGQVTVDVA